MHHNIEEEDDGTIKVQTLKEDKHEHMDPQQLVYYYAQLEGRIRSLERKRENVAETQEALNEHVRRIALEQGQLHKAQIERSRGASESVSRDLETWRQLYEAAGGDGWGSHMEEVEENPSGDQFTRTRSQPPRWPR